MAVRSFAAMHSTDHDTTQTLPAAALAAAVLFALTGLMELLHVQAQPFAGVLDYAIEGAFAAALAAGALAAWALRERGARRAWTAAAAGHGVLAATAAATFARGQDALGPLFLLGLLVLTGGLLAAAAADPRGRRATRGAGVVLLVGWVASIAAGTTLLSGAGWLLVAALATGRLAARAARPAVQAA
jgi:peptidoglycan/LPS O-acetylase OafA/YrhL